MSSNALKIILKLSQVSFPGDDSGINSQNFYIKNCLVTD